MAIFGFSISNYVCLVTFRKNKICQFLFTGTSAGTDAAMLLSDLMPKLNARRALVLEYIFEVPHILLKFRTYISDLMPKLNACRALVLEYIFEVPNIFLKFRISFLSLEYMFL